MEDSFAPLGASPNVDGTFAHAPRPHSATRYRFSTVAGMFCIELRRTGLWRLVLGRRELGLFTDPQSALDVLLDGEAAWPGGPRHAALGLPTELGDWAPTRKAPR